jgi:hypothetical protein
MRCAYIYSSQTRVKNQNFVDQKISENKNSLDGDGAVDEAAAVHGDAVSLQLVSTPASVACKQHETNNINEFSLASASLSPN